VSLETSRISVIIPAYNHGHYLGEAIESVLRQTRRPEEVIVVDSSTDDTASVAKRYLPHIRYTFEPKRGIGSARNAGVRLARGEFLAHLDADDLWVPEKLAVQMEAFARDPDLDLVGGQMEAFFSADASPELREAIFCPPAALDSLSASVIVVKREAFLRVGFYETHWRVAADLNWLLRVRDAGLKTAMIPGVLARRRLHSENSGLRDHEFARERLLALKQALDRRRVRDTAVPRSGHGTTDDET
jgi:glycosyltransferase involved in cell wall biosynthesis